jgi:hypothetical protein
MHPERSTADHWVPTPAVHALKLESQPISVAELSQKVTIRGFQWKTCKVCRRRALPVRLPPTWTAPRIPPPALNNLPQSSLNHSKLILPSAIKAMARSAIRVFKEIKEYEAKPDPNLFVWFPLTSGPHVQAHANMQIVDTLWRSQC